MALATDHEQDDFIAVDFSPDGLQVFLYRENTREYPNEEFRDIEIATLRIASGHVSWLNVWDLMRWNECDAAIDPVGFTADGKVVISARPAVMSPPRRRSCASNATRYMIDLQSRTAGQLPDATKIKRYSKNTREPWETCKDDPDLIGGCFTVHGRLSASNGAPTYRIWRIGSRRILGVANDILPESVATNMGWDVEAFGDYLVCPLSREHPGWMQRVCVESAQNVKYKKPSLTR